jgi:hypothetical protein
MNKEDLKPLVDKFSERLVANVSELTTLVQTLGLDHIMIDVSGEVSYEDYEPE